MCPPGKEGGGAQFALRATDVGQVPLALVDPPEATIAFAPGPPITDPVPAAPRSGCTLVRLYGELTLKVFGGG